MAKRKYSFNLNIHDKIVAAVTLVTVGPLLLLALFTGLEVFDHSRIFFADVGMQESVQVERYVDHYVEDMEEEAIYLASLSEGQPDDLLRRRLIEFHRTHSQIEAILLVDGKTGSFFQVPESDALSGEDFRRTQWYRTALENPEQVVITDSVASPQNAPRTTLVKAVSNDRGAPRGVLALDMGLQKLADKLHNARVGQNGYVMVIDRLGRIIAHSKDQALAGKGADTLGPAAAVLTEATKGSFDAELAGRSVVVNVVTNAKTGWKVLAVVDRNDILASAEASRESILLLAFFVSLIAVAIGSAMARRIVEPIWQVAQAAEAIAAGDLSAPERIKLPADQRDEITVLVETMSAMARKLGHSFRELEEATERKTVEKKLRQQNEYLGLLHKTALTLMNELDVNTVLRMIITSAGRLVGTPHGFIYLLDKDGAVFVRRLGTGIFAGDIGRRIPADKGMVGEVYRTGRPLAMQNSSKWDRDVVSGEILQHAKSVLQVPLRSNTAIVGSIGLVYTEENQVFGAKETELVSQLAELASIALTNARLHTALQGELAERQRTEAALRKSESENRALVTSIPDTMFRISQDGVVLDFRPGVGWTAWDMAGIAGGDKVAAVFPARLARKIMQYAHKAQNADKVLSFEYHTENMKSEWEIRVVVSGHEEVLVIIRDITRRKEMERRLKFLSLHDVLTGIYNRYYFEQEMKRISARRLSRIGVIMCDVDGLKIINDSLGHNCGDKLLMTAAALIRESVPPEAVTARVGGDEFAILLQEASPDDAKAVCRLIRDKVAAYNAKNPGLPLSVSLGFAVCSGGVADVGALYKEADDAMYREKLHRTSSVRSSIVQALVRALEARDFITQGHAERLQKYAVILAEKLGLPERTVADIRLLAHFHDIGKVGISDNILFKSGSLTRRETMEMQRHCEIGYRIARLVPELAPIAEGILRHHEWWNGKGYPLGLAGEQIPLECRIVALADAYDTMTSSRPYRKAMTSEQALAELEKYAGTQFDPRLTQMFKDIVTEKGL